MQILPLDVTPVVANASSIDSTTDDGTPEATVKAAKSVSILAAVYTQANATLTAIRQTAAALDAVEKAAEAVERAKGQHDDTVCFSTFNDLLHVHALSLVTCLYRGNTQRLCAAPVAWSM